MFVKHIQQETGTRVQIKGQGSGFYETETGRESDEPMHIHITYVWFFSFPNTYQTLECTVVGLKRVRLREPRISHWTC
jgi:hypothetical protein